MDDDLAASIQQFCIEKRLTLSIAESCTGGNLAARLTKLPGSSSYFLGSIVAYSNRVKIGVLGVDKSILQEHGAVSAQVVRQMAKGALALTGSDYSLAVTGVAGPSSGESLQPVGTIWAAIAHQRGEPVIWNFHLSGSRQAVIDQAVETILSRYASVLGLIQ